MKARVWISYFSFYKKGPKGPECFHIISSYNLRRQRLNRNPKPSYSNLYNIIDWYQTIEEKNAAGGTKLQRLFSTGIDESKKKLLKKKKEIYYKVFLYSEFRIFRKGKKK